MDRTLSNTLKWIRFPLTLLVILMHVKEAPGFADNRVMEFVKFFFKDTVAFLAVPTFFMISGFLFFHKLHRWDSSLFLEKITHRINTLLIPYILWNLVPILLGVVAVIIYCCVHGSNLLDDLSTMLEKINWLHALWGRSSLEDLSFGFPIDFPLWYVRDLMIMVILCPLIYYLTRWFKIWFVTVFATLCIVFDLGNFEFLIYFSIGAYCALNDYRAFLASKRLRSVVYVCAMVILVLCTMSWYKPTLSDYHRQLLIIFRIFAPLATLYFAYHIEKRGCVRIPAVFYECSFFVYALHSLYMLNFAGMILDIVPLHDSLVYAVVRFFAQAVLTYLLCMLVFLCLEKMWPSLLKLLSGRRVVA